MALANGFASEDLKQITKTIPSTYLISCNTNFVRFVIAPDNPYKTLVVTCQRPANSLNVELSSQTLSSSLLAKLQTICDKETVKVGCSVVCVWETLTSIFERNLLLLCTDEIDRLRNQLQGEYDWLKLSEKNGSITCHVEERDRQFTLDFRIKVHAGYPATPPVIRCLSTTFPSAITDMFIKQAEITSQRCAQGYTAQRSLSDADPAKPPPEVVKLSTLSQFKHDMKYLKEKSEWDAVATNRKNRQLKKLFVKREELLENTNGQQQQSVGASAIIDSTRPVPSVYHVGDFLITKFARLLPHAKCASCRSLLIQDLASFDESDPPERAYCGDWFHSHCLTTVMTTPPFGLQCPGRNCESRVFHAKWTSDVNALEKRWALKAAHEREEEELLDLLDLK